MSHSLCVIGMYDKVKMTVPMVVRYVHSDKKEKRNNRNVLTCTWGVPKCAYMCWSVLACAGV
jgi:hypothetical protein